MEGKLNNHLNDVYREYRLRVFRYICKRSGLDDAADLVQAVMLVYFRRVRKFGVPEIFPPWELLRGIADQETSRLAKKKKREGKVLEMFFEKRSFSDGKLVSENVVESLERYIFGSATLDKQLVRFAELRYLQGLEHGEIAGLMVVDVRTIRRYQSVVKGHLLKCVDREKSTREVRGI